MDPEYMIKIYQQNNPKLFLAFWPVDDIPNPPSLPPPPPNLTKNQNQTVELATVTALQKSSNILIKKGLNEQKMPHGSCGVQVTYLPQFKQNSTQYQRHKSL